MNVNINKLNLKQEYKDSPFIENLEEFAQALYKAKPLYEFVVDNDCTIEMRKRLDNGSLENHRAIRRIKVVENGEEVGAIGVTTRYRGGSSEVVYEVQSFRIRKERGNREAVQAKDLKVALRVAKKTLVSRIDDELKQLIGNSIRDNMSSLHGSHKNQVRWDFSVDEEIAFLAMLGYEARLKGESTITMPSKAFSLSNKDMKKHDNKCEIYAHWNKLKSAYDAKLGYGINVKADNSLVLYSLAEDSITHYKHYDDLPTAIQEKFAMFKVLNENEGYGHIGCKFNGGMFFIAP
jgi:hypothetical protein